MRKLSLLIVGYLSISFAVASDTTAINAEPKAPAAEARDLSSKRIRNTEIASPNEKSHRTETVISSSDTDTLSSSSSSDDTTSPDTTSSSSTPSTSDSESESEEVEDKKTEGVKTVTDEKKEYTTEEIAAIKKAVKIADLRTKANRLKTDAALALRQSTVFSGMAQAEECANSEEISAIKLLTISIDIRYMQQAILHAEETIAESLNLLEELTKLKDASQTSEEKKKAEELYEVVTQSLTETRQKIQILKQDLFMKTLILQIQRPEPEEPTTEA